VNKRVNKIKKSVDGPTQMSRRRRRYRSANTAPSNTPRSGERLIELGLV
jgi:hypothetical protein